MVAHADIAPQRKDDPGPLFPTATAGAAGIGAWPDEQRVAFYLNGRRPASQWTPKSYWISLSRYGYQVTSEMTPAQKKRVIIAFQMHFRPQRWDGVADAQTEADSRGAVREKYGQG